MICTSYEQWKQWQAENYTALPLLYKQPLELSRDKVDSWSKAWSFAHPYAIVLESGKDGRYTYIGLRPTEILKGKGEHAELQGMDSGARQELSGKPLEVVRAWMEPYRAPRLAEGPKWVGGCAGLWSYDVARTIERLPQLAEDDLDWPDYLFMRLDELWIIDHKTREIYCAIHSFVGDAVAEEGLRETYHKALGQAQEMANIWRKLTEEDQTREAVSKRERQQELIAADRDLSIDVESIPSRTSPFSKEAFMDAVRTIQRYIAQGDVFQVNLSLRQSLESDLSPEELYEWLRLFNPSPYMGFLRTPEFQLVSASPELLVESRAGRLVARPIAGTRRRGRTEEEDRLLAEELISNEKERAEHIMLVDLDRNDLGRISEYGTVQVKELMVIEQYSHVMHLVSQVEGQLKAGKDAYDVIAAKFPGGTITGAPKIRTMQIIEEVEPVRRGPYTGSLGWIDYNGDMEFNIIIRTMAVKNGQIHIQAGAGIVIDSDPEREYYESLNKAKALWKAIQYSEKFHEQAIQL
ncbi:anthranilate synthase component I family protein [Paenibacillus sp. GCM10012307]|uniref:Anthranilate synthase component I family protein n=1 Tax=Paenibacillus roseus TaxID=2798579 RepID=A0A934J413_9BACL|nr:anthranilate synthase component I family protein [Paenibacillus roseus]MBJ6361249.1 anthranilate synthase component I family protein [Paenibacillus roseus]